MSEFQLNEPPKDAISSVKFSAKNSQYLLVSSWDSQVRLYDIDTNRLKDSYNHLNHAVLDCSFIDTNRCCSGGLDNSLKSYDFNAQKETLIGIHTEPIRCVHYCPNIGLIITGSWDKNIKLWDIRVANSVGTYDQSEKVYSLDTCDEKLVVGTASRRLRIWNLNNMGVSELRDSSLKYQTRAVRCFPNKQGFVVTSIEGRCAVEYFDMNPETQRKKYAFKCHRNKDEETEYVYPVNAIAFNNNHNTFATGGSDCMVNIWDPFNKKRLCQFHSYPAGITSLAFDYTGKTLAIGSSYNYEQGPIANAPKDSIFIRRVSELETQPK